MRQARIDRGERAGVTTSERDELAELRRENAPVADGTKPAQASDGLLGEGVGAVTRCRWVTARKAEGFPITMACKVADVSRQAFCDWRPSRAGPTHAELAEAALVEEIRSIHDEFDGTYGEPRASDSMRPPLPHLRPVRPRTPPAGLSHPRLPLLPTPTSSPSGASGRSPSSAAVDAAAFGLLSDLSR